MTFIVDMTGYLAMMLISNLLAPFYFLCKFSFVVEVPEFL